MHLDGFVVTWSCGNSRRLCLNLFKTDFEFRFAHLPQYVAPLIQHKGVPLITYHLFEVAGCLIHEPGVSPQLENPL